MVDSDPTVPMSRFPESERLPIVELGSSEKARVDQAQTTGKNKFGKYVLLKAIGRGGMGEVYQAWDPDNDQVVAIKVIDLDWEVEDDFMERFIREVEATARLDHPGVVNVYDTGLEGDQAFYVMELLKGEGLEKHFEEAIGHEEMALLIFELALTLEHAHQNGVIHRDIKPANIILRPSGRPVIVDFGIAADIMASKKLTGTGILLGTPAYMAPELINHDDFKLDGRVDIYSLGILLYRGLTGKKPFNGSNIIQLFRNIMETTPKPPRAISPDIPEALEEICLRCMNKKRDLRYPSCGALAEDLDRLLTGQPIGPLPEFVKAPAAPDPEPSNSPVMILVVVLAVATLIAYFLLLA